MGNANIVRLDDQPLSSGGGTAAYELIDECEAFLDGRYVDQLIHGHRAVPVWAWRNFLAHEPTGR